MNKHLHVKILNDEKYLKPVIFTELKVKQEKKQNLRVFNDIINI